MLVVNPNNRIQNDLAAIEPPLWAALIASYQKAKLLDAEGLDLTLEETEEAIRKLMGPKWEAICIVVMGNNPSVSSTPKMPVAQALAQRLKGFHVWMTGLHPVAVPPGGVLVSPRVFFDFPMMPWGLLPDLGLYRAHNWHCLDGSPRSPYVSMYTSWGCPFDCYYCNIHVLHGGVRYRPMPDVQEELTRIAALGVRNVKIWDELFCLNEERVQLICDFIISKGYDFNMWSYARTDVIRKFNGHTLETMKKAGVNWLAYGFESATDAKYEAAEDAIRITRDAGINIMGNFMFGLPSDTLDDMQRTLDFALEQNLEYVNFSVALPYPGSPWYASLKDKPTDWSSFDQFSPNICASLEVVRFRDEAFQTYFSRPEYLGMIVKKFGVQAEAHINEMLKWKFR